MARNEKKMLGFGLAAAGFFIIALLVACAAMGGAGDAAAPDRIADIRGSDEAVAAGAVTASINYEGRLTDSGGNPLSGMYTMTFVLYETATGGTALATDTHSVTVTDGLFSTTINLGSYYFYYLDGRALWLGITVGADPEMTPRQPFQPVPYALSLRPGAVINGSVSGGSILHVKNENPGGGTGIWAEHLGDYSEGVSVCTRGNHGRGVYASTFGDYSEGVSVCTRGNESEGVYARTYGVESEGVYAYTEGNNSEGVYAYTTGYKSPAVYGLSGRNVGVYGQGKEAGGYFTTTAAGSSIYEKKPGVDVSTQYNYNPGVQIVTQGNVSAGVSAETWGNDSAGVSASTYGSSSAGVSVWTYGNDSAGVSAETWGNDSAGVYAYVQGYDSRGVVGHSLRNYGGYFTSTNYHGLYVEGAPNHYSAYFDGRYGIFVKGDIFKTGSCSFVEDHPTNPSKEIVYVCLEGGETGTYIRGSAQLIDGAAVIQLPEHFSMVTSSEGLTVQVTPTSDCNGLYVLSKSPTEIVVKELNGGTSDATFDYLVNGVRKGYEDFQPIRDKREMTESGDPAQAPEHVEAEKHQFSPEPPTVAEEPVIPPEHSERGG